MLEQGRGESGDFPAYFSNRCMEFPEFLPAANEELTALLRRRQFQSHLSENRSAVYRQYAELTGVLNTAAAKLGTELIPDPVREKRLRQCLTAQGIDCRLAAYYDQAGHLHLELEGTGLAPLCTEERTAKLSKLVNFPLQAVEKGRRSRLVPVQGEPLMAVAGVATKKEDGRTVSGGIGAWSKYDDGSLYVLLCDGMGSGSLVEQESALAIRLLEQFLRAGVRSENALHTLNSALVLRGDEAADGFTTIDLLRVDSSTDEAGIYKYGAIPTYVKEGYSVRRIADAILPAGLTAEEGGSPGVVRLQLEVGDCVLPVTDDMAGSASDQWVRDRLAAFDGSNPRELARALVGGGSAQVGAVDGRTALILKLARRNG